MGVRRKRGCGGEQLQKICTTGRWPGHADPTPLELQDEVLVIPDSPCLNRCAGLAGTRGSQDGSRIKSSAPPVLEPSHEGTFSDPS